MTMALRVFISENVHFFTLHYSTVKFLCLANIMYLQSTSQSNTIGYITNVVGMPVGYKTRQEILVYF